MTVRELMSILETIDGSAEILVEVDCNVMSVAYVQATTRHTIETGEFTQMVVLS